MPYRSLVQLFNGPARRADHDGPDHIRSEPVLADHGWAAETIPTLGLPFNPFARSHNAFCGLDPLRALRVLLFRRRVDCVCGHMESILVVLLLRRLFRFRAKVVLWEVPWSDGWKFREAVARIAVPRADACVVFDSSQVGEVRRRFGESVNVVSVPFCVDTEFFRPGVAGGVGDGSVVVSAGRDGGRDFQVVVDALAGSGQGLVLRTASAVTIDDADRGRVALLVDGLPWDGYRLLYDTASVVVVAARETVNACGVTSLLEGMAMGKAVIVTGTDALSDYLPPDDAGVVVPVGDVCALRDAVLALLRDPERRFRLGRRAREIAVERFSPAVHFGAVARMLDGVAGSAPPVVVNGIDR